MARTIEFRLSPDIRDLEDIRRTLFYPRTLLSQYDNSPRIKALIESFEKRIDPYWDINLFYYKIFNPHTATEYGLDVWGRIVEVSRSIILEGSESAFGFHGSGLQPFNQGPFYTTKVNSYYSLSDEAFRLLIFLKAAINISTGTLANLNMLFHYLFKDYGEVLIIHTGTMRLRGVFKFHLKLWQRALLSYAITPIPAGVGFDIYSVPKDTFGFHGSELKPFNQGAFCPGIKGPKNLFGFYGASLQTFNLGAFAQGETENAST